MDRLLHKTSSILKQHNQAGNFYSPGGGATHPPKKHQDKQNTLGESRPGREVVAGKTGCGDNVDYLGRQRAGSASPTGKAISVTKATAIRREAKIIMPAKTRISVLCNKGLKLLFFTTR